MSCLNRRPLALSIATVAFVAAVPCAAGDVYRCTENGKTVYSDQPCGVAATKVPIPRSPNPDGMDSYRGTSRLGPEGTKLNVSDAVVKECFDGYRIHARDPTTAKNVGWVARIAPSGIPVLTVNGVFTNKYGGPDNVHLWCKLTDGLQIDEAATAPRQRDFMVDQHR